MVVGLGANCVRWQLPSNSRGVFDTETLPLPSSFLQIAPLPSCYCTLRTSLELSQGRYLARRLCTGRRIIHEVMGRACCCKRMGVWVGVGMSAAVLAIPACVLLVWVAMGCMWVLGLLTLVKLVLRLLWSSKVGSAMEEEERKLEEEKKQRELKGAGRMRDDIMGSFFTQQQDSAEMRLSLFQQYLDDQLNTLGVDWSPATWIAAIGPQPRGTA